jgi:hypothetical protein
LDAKKTQKPREKKREDYYAGVIKDLFNVPHLLSQELAK